MRPFSWSAMRFSSASCISHSFFAIARPSLAVVVTLASLFSSSSIDFFIVSMSLWISFMELLMSAMCVPCSFCDPAIPSSIDAVSACDPLMLSFVFWSCWPITSISIFLSSSVAMFAMMESSAYTVCIFWMSLMYSALLVYAYLSPSSSSLSSACASFSSGWFVSSLDASSPVSLSLSSSSLSLGVSSFGGLVMVVKLWSNMPSRSLSAGSLVLCLVRLVLSCRSLLLLYQLYWLFWPAVGSVVILLGRGPGSGSVRVPFSSFLLRSSPSLREACVGPWYVRASVLLWLCVYVW